MQVLEITNENRDHVGAFLSLPHRLYANQPLWVPPLQASARGWFDRAHNPFYQHSQAAFFLALDSSGTPLGRIAVLENSRFNKSQGATNAFFHLFECENDLTPARALFNAAEAWACRRNLDTLVGPKGFSAMDGMGLLIDGFEHQPVLGVPYNLAYYARLLEAVGFETYRDLLSGFLDRSIEFPERIHHLAQKVAQRRGLHIERFTRRKDLTRIAGELRTLYNTTLATMPDNPPLTQEEADELARHMVWFADPRLIKVVRRGERPVGFILAYPDISAAVRKCGGRTLPFGWFHLLTGLVRTRRVILNGAGIIPEEQGLGSTTILISEIARDLLNSRYEFAELVQIRGENERMLREVQKFGVHFYKRHRMYRKHLPVGGA